MSRTPLILLAGALLIACGGSEASSHDAGLSDATAIYADARPAGDDAGAELATSRLWELQEPLVLTITAPMQNAFDAAFAGQPDGIFPPTRVKESFLGTMRYADGEESITLQVKLKVRGNSSLQECAFPKMKMSAFVDEERLLSIFRKAKRTKIATHCDDLGDDNTGIIGRLRNEKAAHREAFIYHAMRIIELPGKWSRPARIVYTDTSLGKANTGWVVERDAFLFDNAANLEKRYGLLLRDENAPWTQADADNVERTLAAKIHFLHALTGNWDWELPLASTGIEAPWNTHLLVDTDGTLIPIAYDFDLSSAVTGRLLRENQLPVDLFPAEPHLVRQAAYYLLPSEELFSDTLRAEVAQFYRGQETALRSALANYPMESDGRQGMDDHLDAFYRALELMYP